MTLRVTDEMIEEMDNLGYEKMIYLNLGFNFQTLLTDLSDVDGYNHHNIKLRIDRLNNDMKRLYNQLAKKYNEKLYFFNNCHNIQKYLNKLYEYAEQSDYKFLMRYYVCHYKDLIDILTLKHQELKSETLEKNKAHMKEHASEKIVCQCGASVSRAVISRHKLTKKHLDNMPLNEVV